MPNIIDGDSLTDTHLNYYGFKTPDQTGVFTVC